MQRRNSAFFILLLASWLPAQAADVNVRVLVWGDVKPGVYGRVDIGGGPTPPLVYATPKVIVRQPSAVENRPLYLHVPPGHAKHWNRHCKKYDACGQPVYFVRSAEYEPKKPKKKEKKKVTYLSDKALYVSIQPLAAN